MNQFAEIWKNDKDLKGAITSFCVYDVVTQSVIAEHNSQTFVVPASTLKVLTTATGLSVLGNNYKYATKIAYTGTFNKETGVLNGDLIIILFLFYFQRLCFEKICSI
jgi:D-alanyl-D-alanine carboxypeptidase/D-alanyl-D-alanine-endopeptidase (penicillin-binding protein 4)